MQPPPAKTCQLSRLPPPLAWSVPRRKSGIADLWSAPALGSLPSLTIRPLRSMSISWRSPTSQICAAAIDGRGAGLMSNPTTFMQSCPASTRTTSLFKALKLLRAMRGQQQPQSKSATASASLTHLAVVTAAQMARNRPRSGTDAPKARPVNQMGRASKSAPQAASFGFAAACAVEDRGPCSTIARMAASGWFSPH